MADGLEMVIAVGLDIVAFLIIVVTFVVVAGHRERTEFHRLILGVTAALFFWTLGDLLRWYYPEGEWSGPVLRLMFVGIAAHAPLWLLLAARCVNIDFWARRQELRIWLVSPSLIAYLLLLTNDAHHLFLSLDCVKKQYENNLTRIFRKK